MIFQRSILREKITLTAVIFFTLFTILTVFFLVRSLNDVNQGKISVDVLLQYLLVVSLGYFPLIMVATVMIALISTIARIYKDSEMVVWQTSGASHWAIFRPVWMLVLPMFGFLLFMNAVMLPWTNQKMSAFRTDNVVSQLNLVKSGSFQTTRSGERTVFVGQVKTGVLPEFEQIFVAQQQTDKNLTVIAQSAKMQESADGRSFLILENGRQYLLEQEKEQVSSMRFGRYGLSLEDLIKVDVGAIKEKPVDQMFTNELLDKGGAAAMSELYRRFSDAFMIIPAAIFAVVLGYVRPRSPKTWGVLMGILILMIYLNVIKIGESNISRGEWRFSRGLLLVHGGFLTLSLLALWYRFNSWRLPNFSLGSLLQKKQD